MKRRILLFLSVAPLLVVFGLQFHPVYAQEITLKPIITQPITTTETVTQDEDYFTTMEEIGGETRNIINRFVDASTNYNQGTLAKNAYTSVVEQAQEDIIAVSIRLSLLSAPSEYESGHTTMMEAIDRLETSISSMLGYLSRGSAMALGNAANYLEWGTRLFNQVVYIEE